MFCPNCGRRLADGARFCDYCGKPVRGSEPTAETVEAVGGEEAKGVAETAVKTRSRKPLVIIVAIVAIVALIAGFLIWRNVDHKTGAPGVKTGVSARPVSFDDSSATAIVNTALRAGAQGDTDTMLRTLTSDERNDYKGYILPASIIRKARLYQDVRVGTVKTHDNGDAEVYLVQGDSVEKSRSIEVKRMDGGYRISDAEGLWLETDSCGIKGYAPLGEYVYSCEADGVRARMSVKPNYAEYGDHPGTSVSCLKGTSITDMKKVKRVFAAKLKHLHEHGGDEYVSFDYSDAGEPKIGRVDGFCAVRMDVTATYTDTANQTAENAPTAVWESPDNWGEMAEDESIDPIISPAR